MPNFNTFNINEVLLGKVLTAKKYGDIDHNSKDKSEARDIYRKWLEKETEKEKSVYHLFLERVTGKKLLRYIDDQGRPKFMEYRPLDTYQPEIKIESTVERPIDFGSDLFGWLKSIHDERKEIEMKEMLDKKITQEQEQSSKKVIEFVNRRMLGVV